MTQRKWPTVAAILAVTKPGRAGGVDVSAVFRTPDLALVP